MNSSREMVRATDQPAEAFSNPGEEEQGGAAGGESYMVEEEEEEEEGGDLGWFLLLQC